MSQSNGAKEVPGDFLFIYSNSRLLKKKNSNNKEGGREEDLGSDVCVHSLDDSDDFSDNTCPQTHVGVDISM